MMFELKNVLGNGARVGRAFSHGKVHVQKVLVRETQTYMSSSKWKGVNGGKGTERMGERLERPQVPGLVGHAEVGGH